MLSPGRVVPESDVFESGADIYDVIIQRRIDEGPQICQRSTHADSGAKPSFRMTSLSLCGETKCGSYKAG